MLAKFGMLGALISAGLLFCACSESNKRESLIQEEVNKKFNAHLLSFEEAKKEVGLKDSECLKKPHEIDKDSYNHYRFIKYNSSGIIGMIRIVDKNSGATDDSFSIYSDFFIDDLKAKYPECFN